MSNGAPLLDATGVHKRYGGVHALRGVNLEIRAGEAHALCGENGAGKSTLINVLAGAVRRDEGRVVLAGREVDFRTPSESQAAGIAVIHQELATLPALSVAENLFMGRLPTRGAFLDRGSMHERARALLADVGLAVDPRMPVRDLSLSNQQLVEIAKALSQQAKLIIMDEPSASLTEHETQNLLDLVRRLRAQGVAILYVSHRLNEVFAVCDRITVFRDGGYVRTVDTADVTPAAVVGLMVGRELAAASAQHESHAGGETVLEVRGLSTRRAGGRGAAAGDGGSVPIDDVSLTVRRGEIVGMAGLVGAGRSEVARAIFGADRYDTGEIRLAGRAVRFRSPSDAIAAGVGMVPEDRKGLALFLEKPVRWSVSMAKLPTLGSGGLIPLGRERALAEDYVRRLRVKTPGIEAPVRALSGGNQQKTVLARWLATSPKLLILDEPTHGVDVGAKAEIYELVRALAREGLAILLISSELPEVLDLSDRIVVMRAGRVAATLDRAQANERTVMLHATGTES